MPFILEALPARHGDALILHFGTDDDPGLAMIDGGPSGVLDDFVIERLATLAEEQNVGDGDRLFFDIGMVSHIDDDHINGIEALTKRMIDDDPPLVPPVEFGKFWHNSFNDILKDDAKELKNPDAMTASVAQGMRLRDNLESLGLQKNPPFGGLILGGVKHTEKGTTLHIVAPLFKQLQKLQAEWAKTVAEMKAQKAKKAEVAEFVDKTAPNLSSIVVLVEQDGKRILLTGDGRGDHTLTGLEEAGIIPKGGKLHVDILKLPHHGSVRNVAATYFERITADHYVISADGRDDNPDVATLKLISAARPKQKFTIHLTHRPDEFSVPAIAANAQAFFDADPLRKYDVKFREKKAQSIRIEL